jgi:hypothetical protein
VISRLRPVPDHPLDDPRLARRLATLRTLCLGVMVFLVGISAGVGLVVWFALDGVPLAGRLVTVGGVSLVTVVAGVLTLAVPVVAVRVGQARGEAGVRELAAEGAADDPEKLLEVFAGVTFAEAAVAGGVGFAWAALFHLTSDPLMLAWVGLLIAFLAARYPTAGRARAWFDAAADRLARERRARTL